jgi:hypothetical protein
VVLKVLTANNKICEVSLSLSPSHAQTARALLSVFVHNGICVCVSLSVQLLSLPLCVALCAAHVTWTGTDKLGFRPRAQFKKKIICRLVYNEIFPLVDFASGARWKTQEVKKLISLLIARLTRCRSTSHIESKKSQLELLGKNSVLCKKLCQEKERV